MLEFSTDSLGTYDDGRLAAALDDAIKRVILDCDDRPALKTARSVSLELKFVPSLIATDREIDSVELTWAITTKAPKQERGGLTLAVYRGGKLGYNPNSLDNPDQKTIFDNQAAEEDDQ